MCNTWLLATRHVALHRAVPVVHAGGAALIVGMSLEHAILQDGLERAGKDVERRPPLAVVEERLRVQAVCVSRQWPVAVLLKALGFALVCVHLLYVKFNTIVPLHEVKPTLDVVINRPHETAAL